MHTFNFKVVKTDCVRALCIRTQGSVNMELERMHNLGTEFWKLGPKYLNTELHLRWLILSLEFLFVYFFPLVCYYVS